jgi:hypothetical protein
MSIITKYQKFAFEILTSVTTHTRPTFPNTTLETLTDQRPNYGVEDYVAVVVGGGGGLLLLLLLMMMMNC